MIENSNQLFESYLSESRKMQNFVIVLALLEAIGLLYFMRYLIYYRSEYSFIIPIVLAFAINLGLLWLAYCEEVRIVKDKFQDSYILARARRGMVFRAILIIFISAMTLYFLGSSSKTMFDPPSSNIEIIDK